MSNERYETCIEHQCEVDVDPSDRFWLIDDITQGVLGRFDDYVEAVEELHDMAALYPGRSYTVLVPSVQTANMSKMN